MLTSVVAMAQTPAFDAASIKPNVSGGGPSSIRLTPGHVSMQNVSLKKVMLNAYGIQDDREYMIAGPEWLTAEHFDVEAAFPATAQVSAVQQMIQSLLADRFKLVLHKESRDLPNYRLVVAKGGPKISPVEAGASQTSGGAGHFVASKITMQKFADLVARQAGRPVMDETGLSGVFTFSLDWSPAASLRVDSAESGDSSSGPSIFTALQEQLGLKLEPGKGPMDVLVVDRMEKLPTEN
jgi:uncharacterized protein (TIGR03435 family)